ncbi:DUF981 family protein [Sulfolobus acidocaldarius]|uniref:Conserved Archaeal membrane protein n=4 Tax=Sulfolobus acidocaldarius TaxID=2285 RepID=Q4JBW2_SULAC|nr:DUF981 domain-containing protein [Sulfolobus acidocaldarius]AAY79717.1 conserved Archaeal membrane protein [Sulfolobus acidocaldarius DSM 639]AGE70276.1 hypothetical protein SacN8_01475 [Sulfolobus acidocaldarius N8]AGE72551.1 hypothetical protein SacRon12I_01475 [Sulfolobus acidocaldarius Ron12/I]ALU30568.1 hypothetical protein ATY89_04775 [Sulfolobus acidocaldarius]ALU32830.1 hypothetical protein ATZ20_07800 [Sulfolobus acidocaldarius]
MALFIDPLTSQLIVLASSFLVLAYGFIKTYFTVHSSIQEYRESLRSLYMPLLVMGSFMAITGLYGLLVWPLPGSYNILFYDLYPILGLGLMGIAFSLKNNYKLELFGFLALILGLVTIYYGVQGYFKGLTTEPIALLGLYTLVGLASFFFYPVSIFVDNASKGKIFLIIDSVFLILSALLAGYIALEAVPAHLSGFAHWTPFL